MCNVGSMDVFKYRELIVGQSKEGYHIFLALGI